MKAAKQFNQLRLSQQEQKQRSFTLFNQTINEDRSILCLSNNTDLNMDHLLSFIEEFCIETLQQLNLSNCNIKKEDLLKFSEFVYRNQFSFNHRTTDLSITLEGNEVDIETAKMFSKDKLRSKINLKLDNNLSNAIYQMLRRGDFDSLYHAVDIDYFQDLQFMDQSEERSDHHRLDRPNIDPIKIEYLKDTLKHLDIKEFTLIIYPINQDDMVEIKKFNTLVQSLTNVHSLKKLTFNGFCFNSDMVKKLVDLRLELTLQYCSFLEGKKNIFPTAIKELANSASLQKLELTISSKEEVELLNVFSSSKIKKLSLFLSSKIEEIDPKTLEMFAKNFDLTFDVNNSVIMQQYNLYRQKYVLEFLSIMSSIITYNKVNTNSDIHKSLQPILIESANLFNGYKISTQNFSDLFYLFPYFFNGSTRDISSLTEDLSFRLFYQAISTNRKGLLLMNKKNLNIDHLLSFIAKKSTNELQILDLSNCNISKKDLLKFIDFFSNKEILSQSNRRPKDYLTIYLNDNKDVDAKLSELFGRMKSPYVRFNLGSNFFDAVYKFFDYSELKERSISIEFSDLEKISTPYIKRLLKHYIKYYQLNLNLLHKNCKKINIKKLNKILKFILSEEITDGLGLINLPLSIDIVKKLARSSLNLSLLDPVLPLSEKQDQLSGAITILCNSENLTRLKLVDFNPVNFNLLKTFDSLNLNCLSISFLHEHYNSEQSISFTQNRETIETIKKLSSNLNLRLEVESDGSCEYGNITRFIKNTFYDNQLKKNKRFELGKLFGFMNAGYEIRYQSKLHNGSMYINISDLEHIKDDYISVFFKQNCADIEEIKLSHEDCNELNAKKINKIIEFILACPTLERLSLVNLPLNIPTIKKLSQSKLTISFLESELPLFEEQKKLSKKVTILSQSTTLQGLRLLDFNLKNFRLLESLNFSLAKFSIVLSKHKNEGKLSFLERTHFRRNPINLEILKKFAKNFNLEFEIESEDKSIRNLIMMIYDEYREKYFSDSISTPKLPSNQKDTEQKEEDQPEKKKQENYNQGTADLHEQQGSAAGSQNATGPSADDGPSQKWLNGITAWLPFARQALPSSGSSSSLTRSSVPVQSSSSAPFFGSSAKTNEKKTNKIRCRQYCNIL